ncbi:MAG: hypothetical protein P4M15_01725 [Alphaproteobacteria bacterium]|nr:hypothetical protein [Alphaproteobacteria bacterium]
MQASVHSFPVLLPHHIRQQIQHRHQIGFFDIGVPLNVVKAEIFENLRARDDGKWTANKSWSELLVADGHVIERDGEPVNFLDEIRRFQVLSPGQSKIYGDIDRMLPYHLRHQPVGKLVYESPNYKVRLTQGLLRELGGDAWPQKLLVADNDKAQIDGRIVSLKGRIIGVDDHPVGTNGHVLDERGRQIGDIKGYKVVGLEPPRPGDSWLAALPLDTLRVA